MYVRKTFHVPCSDTGAALVAQWVKHLPAMWETRVQCLGCEDPLEKETATHSSTLAGKSHGQRSLVGYSPWGPKELDTTERLHFNPSTATYRASQRASAVRSWQLRCRPWRERDQNQGLLLLLLSHFSRVRLYATPKTAAHPPPLSLGFSSQEYWSGLPLPSPSQGPDDLNSYWKEEGICILDGTFH